jgi:polysaccharide export outer membrane protein
MRMVGSLRGVWLVCCVSGLVLVAGCHAVGRHEAHEFDAVPPPQNELVTLGGILPIPASSAYAPLDMYPLRVGDQLTFTLSVDSQPQPGAYRIMVNDQLTVEYLHELPGESRARTMRVLSNGTIDLPLIGSVQVAGRTVEEVRQEVNERAKKFYTYPEIALSASDGTRNVEELRRAFSSGFTNQSLTVVVGPDGTINLPEIGTVPVFGKTVSELRDEVNQLYEQKIPGAHVWPHIAQRAPDQVHLLGEVRSPGRYLIDRPTHVSQLIAQGGGWNLGAELHEVVLIRYEEGCPKAVVLNLHQAIRHDHRPRTVDLTDDVLLADGDVVIVPRDSVQNADDFIRRVFTEGAYGVIPVPHTRR